MAGYLAISGGVGGAKLALGLSHALTPDELTIVANTGDDFVHHGLAISPDLDTVMYTLAGVSNPDLGWGQAGESWNFLSALGQIGGEDWFRLGDRDVATHVLRSERLAAGHTLSEVTESICTSLGIMHPVVPMSDDRISTVVHTDRGEALAFQHYFVRDRCEPVVTGFDFDGIGSSSPSRGFAEALDDEVLKAIIICPSNPFVSVDPVLSIPGVRAAIEANGTPVVAVSPIVSGLAIKGPAAKMMGELGMPTTAAAVAEHYVSRYGDLLSGFVLDVQDEELLDAVRALGVRAIATNTVMVTLQDRIRLANEVLEFGNSL